MWAGKAAHLVEVGGSHVPGFAGEGHIVGVVHLAQVVEAATLHAQQPPQMMEWGHEATWAHAAASLHSAPARGAHRAAQKAWHLGQPSGHCRLAPRGSDLLPLKKVSSSAASGKAVIPQGDT